MHWEQKLMLPLDMPQESLISQQDNSSCHLQQEVEEEGKEAT